MVWPHAESPSCNTEAIVYFLSPNPEPVTFPLSLLHSWACISQDFGLSPFSKAPAMPLVHCVTVCHPYGCLSAMRLLTRGCLLLFQDFKVFFSLLFFSLMRIEMSSSFLLGPFYNYLYSVHFYHYSLEKQAETRTDGGIQHSGREQLN